MSKDRLSSLAENKVVCPHCWHSFYPDEALYISQHRELFGDPVAGDVPKRFSPTEVERNREGKALDSMGWEMVERACPRCHLQIPPDLVTRRPLFLSVVGAPRSGKSYFLTVMFYHLRKELAKAFAYSLDVSDCGEKSPFIKYVDDLFYSKNSAEPVHLEKTQRDGQLYTRVQMDSTDVYLPKPFIFSLRPTQENIKGKRCRFVLYDNAGESFQFGTDDDGERRVTQHLGESDAIMFALDPLQDPEARNRLMSVSQDLQLTDNSVSFRQEDILSTVIRRIRKYTNTPEGKPFKARLTVCVQKYDVWKTLVPYASVGEREFIDHSSVEFDRAKGLGGLDVEEIDWISVLIRNFVNDLCPEFVALAEANFAKVRYFPVSADGSSPELHEGYLKVRPIDIQPFRVTHPMLWLMREWGLIYRANRKISGESRHPHARLMENRDGHIRIVSPSSQRMLTLDSGYLGSSIVDPFTGRMMWIPRAVSEEMETKSTAVATSSPSPSSSSDPVDDLKLKLDDVNTSRKRRWWGGK